MIGLVQVVAYLKTDALAHGAVLHARKPRPLPLSCYLPKLTSEHRDVGNPPRNGGKGLSTSPWADYIELRYLSGTFRWSRVQYITRIKLQEFLMTERYENLRDYSSAATVGTR